KVAERMGLEPGSQLTVAAAAGKVLLEVVGTVETGAAEDSQIFVPLQAAQSLLGRPGKVSLIQVSAVTNNRTLQDVAATLERAVPGSTARVVGQIADAEAAVLDKVRLLVGLVALLVLLAAGLAVGSTLAAGVLERTKEVGLMKALGAHDWHVALIFLAEAGSIGVAGGLAGYGVGLGLATAIGRIVFGAPIAFTVAALPLAVSVGVGVCLLASALPVRRALAVDPATTLRGE
ncbi:MAG: ABC transporter permease, partial [Chloroflexota bacterium]